MTENRGGLALYPITLGPLEYRKFNARGNFIRVRNADAEVTVKARSSKLAQGDGVVYSLVMRKFEKLYADTEFDVVELKNESETLTNDVVLMIGYGDFEQEILSRSQAAESIVAAQLLVDDLFVDTASGATPELLIAENSLRKRIKIRACMRNVVITGGALAALNLFITHNASAAAFDATDGFPLLPWKDVGDADLLTGVFSGHEVELETTDAIYVRAGFLRDAGCLCDFTCDAVFSIVEEIYST